MTTLQDLNKELDNYEFTDSEEIELNNLELKIKKDIEKEDINRDDFYRYIELFHRWRKSNGLLATINKKINK